MMGFQVYLADDASRDLDFQLSATEYIPRSPTDTSLEELLRSAEKVEKGVPLSADLDEALLHGSSIGGARPKALIEDHNVMFSGANHRVR
ncbi:hypothetical protein DPPLL_12430 [Desulfofustis limnaeus]|jgi:serine/threonine-protein kinase HipA|uniref:Uncharacterized protein n=1 Tax=Desulfofustis limnaeus TaxID=2740163 RepID=A0ABM7W7F6_9BACT|nr:hypothetical protein [Desulfofustis limnaeus]BDD86878.1 hypothetical protein DPPLL_12430 [Desulfofustis limnaeus]